MLTDMQVIRSEVEKIVPRLNREVSTHDLLWVDDALDSCYRLFAAVRGWADAMFGRRVLTWDGRPFLALPEQGSPAIVRKFYEHATYWQHSQALSVAVANISWASKHKRKKDLDLWLLRCKNRVKDLRVALEELSALSVEIDGYMAAASAIEK